MTKNEITNTAAKSKTPEGAKDILMEAMANQLLGVRQGQDIEDMEARGQQELCNVTTRLPVDFNEWGEGKGKGKPTLEAAGVKFLGPVEGDDQFQEVTLPEGWEIKPTEHSMWSELVDSDGRKRAAIFYKAAFYDRKAHIDVSRRFDYRTLYPEHPTKTPYVAVVTDGGREVWRSGPLSGSDEARDAARAHLAETWPDWDNLTSYWNEGK